MKNSVVGSLVFAVSISMSAFAYTRLLSQEDLVFEELDRAQGVAIGSALDNERSWGSYNQWQCFNISKLSYDCADYDNEVLVPSLKIETEQEILHFDLHVEDKLECFQTLTQWRSLVDSGEEVCIFAAYIPDVDMGLDKNKPQSLWYLSRIKGVGGYWSLVDESPEFKIFN